MRSFAAAADIEREKKILRRKAVDKAGFAADDNAAAAAVVVVNKAGMIFADDAAEFDIAESAADRCLFKLNGNREIVFRKQLDVGWQSENASLEQTRFTGLHIAYILSLIHISEPTRH